MASSDYNASSIEVFDKLDAVRQNLSVYISDLDSHGIFKCYREPIVNTFDEFRNGHGKTVYVIVDKTGFWTTDEARGIPVEIHPKTKESTLTTVLTRLSAGGKMKKEGSSYGKATAGTHGMGVAITNAASKSFQAWTFRGGKWYSQSFAKGKEVTGVVPGPAPVLPHLNISPKRGTTIRFTPDLSLFDPESKLDMAVLKRFLELSSYTHAGLKIILVTPSGQTEYYQPNGLTAFLDKLVGDLQTKPLSKSLVLQTEEMSLALQWVNSDQEHAHAFVNGTPTQEGGTHVNGLTKAISEALDPYTGKRANKFKPEDLRTGLVYVLNAEVFTPKFTTQVKDKLRSPEATALVYDAVKDGLKAFFDKNKSVAREIIKRANDFAKVNENAAAAKKSVAGLRDAKNKKSLPAKLSTSTTKNPDERWLYTVEGDSAAGNAVNARDAHFQEILRLRGKILNVYAGNSDAKIIANEEIKSFLAAVGYDAQNKGVYRVGRVVIMADEDVDGNHISVLVLLCILKMMPDMIERGMVYILLGSLYTAADKKGKRYYADTMDELRQKAGAGLVANTVTRMKGWGEAEVPWLIDLAFGDTAKFLKVTPSSKEDIDDFISLVCDGPEAVARRFELLGSTGAQRAQKTALKPTRSGKVVFRFSSAYRSTQHRHLAA